MCLRKEGRGPRQELIREAEEEGEKVARVVEKEVGEVEMMKLERKRELRQLKVEKWLKVEVVVVRELGRKRRTRRKATKIRTKKVEEE